MHTRELFVSEMLVAAETDDLWRAMTGGSPRDVKTDGPEMWSGQTVTSLSLRQRTVMRQAAAMDAIWEALPFKLPAGERRSPLPHRPRPPDTFGSPLNLAHLFKTFFFRSTRTLAHLKTKTPSSKHDNYGKVRVPQNTFSF